jgi:preprotein translocase SecE subunit
MALGIYKAGQGYWVRVLTAAFAGVLVLAGAAWLWNQLETAARWIPVSGYTMVTSQAPAFAGAGTTVNLIGAPTATDQPPPTIGTAEVTGPAERGVHIGKPRMNAGVLPNQTKAIASADGQSVPVAAVNEIRAFEPIYLQAAGVGVLLLIGALVLYYYVGARPSSAEFLIATDGEMKKVNWSTRRDILSSTWVVILWAFLIAGGLFVVDAFFSSFFHLIGVLQG